MRPVRSIAAVMSRAEETNRWRRLVATVLVAAVASVGLVSIHAAPAQAAAYTNSRCGNSSGRVLLTFDDWAYGDPYRATRTGAYLQSRNIRAAFFLINQEAQSYPDIVTTLRQQGHWVLNHSFSHPDLTTLSDAAVSAEISQGISTNLLRPPYGAYDSRVAAIASGLGYRICTWTVDSLDWQRPDGVRYRSASSIRSIVRTAPRSAKVSGVVLGHLATNFPSAISGIIYDLQRQGLLLCRNRGPVGRLAPFPLACT
jgi:peptidoglycan/xylan/chitin deacetylase (PgdA/CDA1 family)